MNEHLDHNIEQTGIASNPLAVVAGGIVIGAIIAALLPRTQRETSAIGSVGKVINSRAKEAVAVARDVGAGKARELGLTGDSAMGQMKALASKASEAAKAALAEAANAARGKSGPV